MPPPPRAEMDMFPMRPYLRAAGIGSRPELARRSRRRRGLGRATWSFRRLKWLSIVAPIAVIAGVHFVTNFVLEDFVFTAGGFVVTVAVAGAVMLMVGLLILSGNDSIVEQLVV